MRQRLCMLLLLPLLAGGCVTHKLWSEKRMDEWNEPASNPNLRLFHDDRQNDFLVVYEEFSNRHDSTRTRAFFLRQNVKLLAQNKRPQFIGTNLAPHLPPVPVFSSAPAIAPEHYYALVTTNRQSFTLFSGNRELEAYSLPNYNDGVGRWERSAWTPFTVAADLSIVGGVLAIICWDALSESGTTINGP